MKHLYFISAILIAMVFASCNDYETYAEKKDTERDAIKTYLAKNGANIISEEEFRANGCVTDTLKKEWVLLSKSSVYMQVINKGTFYDQTILEKEGRKVELDKRMKQGQTSTILCRFSEVNLLTGNLTCYNLSADDIGRPEMMTVTRSTDTYQGSFVAASSAIYSTYGTLSVPTGWLVPLQYINIGRCGTPYDEIAKLRLIVPHSQGQPVASQNVIPCLYELTYQEGK